jgi:hypothetical protein
MRRLVYLSVPTKRMTDADLEGILSDARATNSQFGVTGVLVYQDEMFFQCLEGPDDSVGRIFDKIGQSTRHRTIKTLLDEKVEDRIFPDWSMGYEPVLSSSGLEGYRSVVDIYSQADKKEKSGSTSDLVRQFLLGEFSQAA